MVDFVGRGNTGIYDDMGAANQYWDEAHDAAQRLWANRELRRRTDEANRYNRDEANSALDFYNQNAGLVENRPNDLAGLRPLGLQPVAANGAATAATASAPAASGPVSLRPTPAATQPPVAPGAATEANPRVLPPAQPGLAPAATPPTAGEQWVPVQSESELTPEQLRAHQDYIRANYGGLGSRARRESTQRRAAELGLSYDMHGQLLRRTTSTGSPGLNGLPEHFDISGYGGSSDVPSADVSADTQTAGVSDPNHSSASEYLQYASEDTSRPLQPTYEMNLIDVALRNSMRQARVAAQHGRNDIAQQAFNMTLQGLAAHRQQENLVLLRAAADGSERAASALISRFHGYPPGTVEVHETARGSGMYVLQIRGEDGQMRMATQGAPMTRSDLINRLQTLADRETAAAQAEITAENQRAFAENQTDIRVAEIGRENNILDNLTEAEIARARMINDRAMQRAQVATFGDGGIAMIYNTTDENGQPAQQIEIIREEQLPTANVDGRRNQTTPTITRRPAARVTGTVGVR